MENEERTNLVEKIRALLAKAASSEHEPEQAAFQAKAAELMARYKIADAELRDRDDEIDYSTFTYSTFGHATKSIAWLFNGIAPLFGCAVLYFSGRVNGSNSITVKVFGATADIDLLGAYVDALLPQLRADINRDRPRSRMSYGMGWAETVGRRFEETFTQTWEASNSSALIPTATKAEEARDAQSKKSTPQKVSRDDYSAGSIAGSNADLGGLKLG